MKLECYLLPLFVEEVKGPSILLFSGSRIEEKENRPQGKKRRSRGNKQLHLPL